MKLELEQTVHFGDVAYYITDGPFNGYVSDVYTAKLVDTDLPVVIKLVRHDTPDDEKKIEGLNNEGNTLRVLNQVEDSQWQSLPDVLTRAKRAQETAIDRYIIANFDHGEIAPGTPYLVQEMAPPEFKRLKIESIADEIRTLEVALATARGMEVAHTQNFTLDDFVPPTKFDRLRAGWNDLGQLIFKLIDWNITGTPAEYREKASLDMFYFAQYLYYMLTGGYVTVDRQKRPPADLSTGGANWSKITEGSRQILQKALQRNERVRYQRPSQIANDLAWWLETLKTSQSENAVTRLEDRGWQAKQTSEYSRLLAVSNLALRLNLPEDKRRSFERWEEQGRKELEKRELAALVDGRSSLLTVAYEKAIKQFAEVLLSEDEQSEVARQARLYQMQSQIGRDLQTYYKGDDIRQKEEWRSLEIAITQLRESKWQGAITSLRASEKARPELKDIDRFEAFQDLLAITNQFIVYDEHISRKKPLTYSPLPTDPDWVKAEGEKIELLHTMVAQLKQSAELAPKEPFFREQYETEFANLQDRERRYHVHKRIHQHDQQARQKLVDGLSAHQAGKWAEAGKLFKEVMEQVKTAAEELHKLERGEGKADDPHDGVVARQLQELQSEAESYYAHAQRIATAVVKRAQANEAVRQGEYAQAVTMATEAEDSDPGNGRMQEILQIAEAGGRILRKADTEIAPIRTQLKRPQLTLLELQESLKNLDDIARWQGQSFPNLDVIDTFMFPQTLREEINSLRETLQERLKQNSADATTAYRQAKDAIEAGNYGHALEHAELTKSLNPQQKELEALLAEIRVGIQVTQQIESLLLQVERLIFRPGIDTLPELQAGRKKVSQALNWQNTPFTSLPQDLFGTQLSSVGRNFRLNNPLREHLTEQSRRLSKEIDKSSEYQRVATVLEKIVDNRQIVLLLTQLTNKLKSIDGNSGEATEEDFNRYLSDIHREMLQATRGQLTALQDVRKQLQQEILSWGQLEAIVSTLDKLGDAAQLSDWQTVANKWESLCKQEKDVADVYGRTTLRNQLQRGILLFDSDTKTIENPAVVEALAHVVTTMEAMTASVVIAGRVQAALENPTAYTLKPEVISLHNDLTSLQNSWPMMAQQAALWQAQFDEQILSKYLRPFVVEVARHQADAKANPADRDEYLILMLQAAQSGWEELPPDLQERWSNKNGPLFKEALQYMTTRQAVQAALAILLKQHGGTDEFQTAARQMTNNPALMLDSLPELYKADLQAMLEEIKVAAEQEEIYAKSPEPSTYAQYIKECQALTKREITALTNLDLYSDQSLFASYRARLTRKVGEIEQTLKDDLEAEVGKLKQQLTSGEPHSPHTYLSFYWQMRWLERDDEETLNQLLQQGEGLARWLAEEARRHFGSASKEAWQKQWPQKLLNHVALLQRGLFHPTDEDSKPWAGLDLPEGTPRPTEKEIYSKQKLKALQKAIDLFPQQMGLVAVAKPVTAPPRPMSQETLPAPVVAGNAWGDTPQ